MAAVAPDIPEFGADHADVERRTPDRDVGVRCDAAGQWLGICDRQVPGMLDVAGRGVIADVTAAALGRLHCRSGL